ncbi:MAG: hypothetical protein PHQ75_04550, partial [Thermoguttaceae bacterium]|nr:hypothetical protein [Thermoguttaceae bacterium]
MAESTGKNYKGIFIFLILLAVVFVVTLGYTFAPLHKSETAVEPVFSGWIYLREDQKVANAVMAKAKLTQYRWKDGELSVPREEKARYETVLAEAKAFPRAPGDVKRDALREMSQFEPMAKMKLRDLYSAGWQLEQTIEHFSTQISYATVGVRSRPEQQGMIQKNVVTASVGVWPKDDKPLSTELLSAITLATKHHLGITENNDISILDLRHGCSYLGTDEGVTAPVSKEAREEHLRQEFWNEKFLIAFRHITGIKVSTSIVRPVARTAPVLTLPEQQDRADSVQPKTFAVLGNRLPTTQVSRPASSSVPVIYASGQGDLNITPDAGLLPAAPNRQPGDPKQRVADASAVSTPMNQEDETKISVEIGIPEDYVRGTIALGQNSGTRQAATAQEIALKGNEIAASVKEEATRLLHEVFTASQTRHDNPALVRVTILPPNNEQTAMSPGGMGATVLEKPVRPNEVSGNSSNDSAVQGQVQVESTAAGNPGAVAVNLPVSSSSENPSLEARLVELWNSNKHSPLFWTLAVVLTLILTAMVLARVSFLFKRVAAVYHSCFGGRKNTSGEEVRPGID